MGERKDLTVNDIIGYCKLDMFAVESGYENIEQLQEELAAYCALGTPEEIKARLENSVVLPKPEIMESNASFEVWHSRVDTYCSLSEDTFDTYEAAEKRLKELEEQGE